MFSCFRDSPSLTIVDADFFFFFFFFSYVHIWGDGGSVTLRLCLMKLKRFFSRGTDVGGRGVPGGGGGGECRRQI